jgi:pyruvate dehydrogenase E1 component
MVPTCLAYDPSYVYELIVILQEGLRRMYVEQHDVFYYIALLNENCLQPAMPTTDREALRAGIIAGMYLLKSSEAEGANGVAPRVQLMGSGAILNEVIAAADLLARDFGVAADIWSIPGVNQLHRQGIEVERWNRFHPEAPRKVPYVTSLLQGRQGPAIIATDYIRAYPEQIRRLVPMPLTILGTDGYGRSDTREELRKFFEVDRYHIALAAIEALASAGTLNRNAQAKAIALYGVDPDKPDPLST